MMQIITFSSSKGGVGKTTLTYNFGCWLAHQNKRVLFIDADYQANLSSLFGEFSNSGSLLEVFNGGDPVINHVGNNIDLLPASPFLDKVETLINDRMYQDLIMLSWFKQNLSRIESYDYILIDTHPEFTWLTKNMIAVSDLVFVPIEPSEFGFKQSKNQFDIRMQEYRNQSINPRTGISEIDAKVYYVGNLIEHNTNSSFAFKEAIAKLPEVVASIEKRELLKSTTLYSTPVVDMPESKIKSQKAFVTQLFTEFEKMKAQGE